MTAETTCTHPERDDHGLCTTCGDCLHDVILNGTCVYCGSRDIDPRKASPKPEPLISPASLLKKG